MNIVNLLLPIALILASGFIAAFVWASRKGQYDDLETPAHRILLDDQPYTNETTQKGKQQ